MKFEENEIISSLNESWGWVIPQIENVLAVNSMANCFVKDIHGQYWRVCPEELSAKLEARNDSEVQQVFNDPEYKEDWQFLALINPAEEALGKLEIGQCYAMIKPAVIGGEYSVENLRLGSICEYLSFSGELAYKTRDLKDGDHVSINVTK